MQSLCRAFSMPTPELSIGGQSLLYDWQHQAAKFFSDFQPLEDLVLQVDQSVSRAGGREASRGTDDVNLPLPNYPPEPPPRINQLYWPTGAGRWAKGYFLATKTVAESLTCGVAMTFKAATDRTELSTKLYALPPHPVSEVHSATQEPCENLYLVPLVDERYWWQLKDFGDKGAVDITTWGDLFNHLSKQLDTTFSAPSSGGYLIPDPSEFTRRYDNAALILDAAAHSVGHRVVRQLNGSVEIMSWTLSKARLQDSTNSSTEWFLIAGEDYDHEPVSATVRVAFPKLDCGLRRCGDQYHVVDNDYQGQRCKRDGTIKTIHSTAWAGCNNTIFRTQGGPPVRQIDFLNSAELDGLASRITSDYYESIEHAYDYTYLGIKQWNFSGYDDHALYSFGNEFDEPRLEANEDTGVVAAEYSRNYTTRIQSAPLNFGVDQMLHQSEVIGNRTAEGVMPVELAAGECFEPGGQAIVHHLDYIPGSGWHKSTCQEIVFDSFYRTFAVEGERFWVRPGCEIYPTKLFETVGEYGLTRRASALEAIPCGQSGQVQVYANPLDGGESCNPKNSGCEVTACNNWACGRDIEPGDEIFIHFFERVWQILPGGGGQGVDIALVQAVECLFPGDQDKSFLLYELRDCLWIPTGNVIGANDLCKRNMFIPGECGFASRRANCGQQRAQYDMLGSHGLSRVGRVLEDVECGTVGLAKIQITSEAQEQPGGCGGESHWRWTVPFGQPVENGFWKLDVNGTTCEANCVPKEPPLPANPTEGMLGIGPCIDPQQPEQPIKTVCKRNDSVCPPIRFCNGSGRCLKAEPQGRQGISGHSYVVYLQFYEDVWIGTAPEPNGRFKAKLAVTLCPEAPMADVRDVEAMDVCMDEQDLEDIKQVTNYGFSGRVDDTIFFWANNTKCDPEYHAINVEHHCYNIPVDDTDCDPTMGAFIRYDTCQIQGHLLYAASIMTCSYEPSWVDQIQLVKNKMVTNVDKQDQSSGSGSDDSCGIAVEIKEVCTFEDLSNELDMGHVIEFIELENVVDVIDNTGTKCIEVVVGSTWSLCPSDPEETDIVKCYGPCPTDSGS